MKKRFSKRNIATWNGVSGFDACSTTGMKRSLRYIKFFNVLFWLCVFMLPITSVMSETPGFVPSNYDGFETGDYQNFLPKYIGESSDWIRPRFKASDTDPINGQYSLKWEAGEDDHDWLLVSNGFYMARPFTLTAEVRVEGEGQFRTGLALLETYDKFSGLHFDRHNAGIHLDAQDWKDADLKPFAFEGGVVYKLRLRLDESGELMASIFESAGRKQLVDFTGQSSVLPSAMAFYVHTPEDSDVDIRFDEVTIDAAPYRVKAETWTRASIPYYVTLPQKGDVEQSEGHWVGGHTLFKRASGDYAMWYRIRTAKERGEGYGFASSQDGLTWGKYEDNPIFFPDPETYSSNEKISVLKVDGKYHAWYTVEVPGKGWNTGYCHSKDGLHWQDEGLVIHEQYTKDPDVIYVDGIFYLYAISPTNTDFAIYTSTDGIEWEQQNIIEMGIHRHPSAYYDKKEEKFWLYAFGLHLGVHRAWSEDGIHFTDFEPVWHEPAAGIDDWRAGGVDYGVFLRDEQGHILDTKNRILYYQGRNNYGNNHPGWNYHGSERVLLAGWFTGLHIGIPTHVAPNKSYEYKCFPWDAERIEGLFVQSTSPALLTIDFWTPDESTVANGDLRGDRGTSWRFEITEGLEPESTYNLLIGEEVVDTRQSGTFGNTVLRGNLPKDGIQSFRIERNDD